MINFHVGQKVVCIRGLEPGSGYGWEIQPEINEVYTIRDIDCERESCPDPIGLRLVEIVNKPALYYGCVEPSEGSFGSSRFRPVVERKTDISIFTEMLHSVPERV